MHLDYWRLSFACPEERADAVERMLEDYIDPERDALTTDESARRSVTFDLYLAHAPDLNRLGDALKELVGEAVEIHSELIGERDWVVESDTMRKPVRAGRFYIHGSHIDEPPPRDTIAVLLDAGQAFGTGAHETTYGALLAIDRLLAGHRIEKALDLGTGSGLLAIALSKAGVPEVSASDIDRSAIRIATENARQNNSLSIAFLVADGLDHDDLIKAAPFDLICANILAAPLIAMAGAIAKHLTSGGFAILSGLLEKQERSVSAAYRDAGLEPFERIAQGIWPTLVLQKN